MSKKLTPKQARFVEEYLIDLNGTQAAIRAGYAEKSAKVAASRLLTNDNIRAAFRKALAAQSKRTELSADWVIQRLAEVHSRCMEAEPVLDRKGKPTGVYRFDSSGANKSLELIGKHFGAFPNKVDLTVDDPVERLARVLGIKPEELPE